MCVLKFEEQEEDEKNNTSDKGQKFERYNNREKYR